MIQINVSNGIIVVDDEDVNKVMQKKWYVRYPKRGSTPYCYTWVYTGGKVIATSLHRFITGTIDKDSVIIDHIDHDGLNNQKGNLRVCSCIENAWNKQKGRNNTSGYKGVTWKNNKWCARIMKENIMYDLGSYSIIEDAAFSYDIAALYLFGEFSCTNFDKDMYEGIDIKNEYSNRLYIPTSHYRGVVQRKTNWETTVCVGRKTNYIGRFSTELEAALAYDKKAYELLGDKAKLNFPERIDEYKGVIT